MGKYDHLVFPFEHQKLGWGDFMPAYQTYFRGHDMMPDSTLYASYRCYMKEAFLDRTSNFHSEEELLCFVGYDMVDPWGSFDAEIHFSIGKDLDHMEEHIITEPTIVRIPAFYWHCPLEFVRVTKPVYFQVVHLRGKFGTYDFREKDGAHKMIYTQLGGAKPCVEDPTKKCTLCGKCWRKAQDAREAAAAAAAAEKA